MTTYSNHVSIVAVERFFGRDDCAVGLITADGDIIQLTSYYTSYFNSWSEYVDKIVSKVEFFIKRDGACDLAVARKEYEHQNHLYYADHR